MSVLSQGPPVAVAPAAVGALWRSRMLSGQGKHQLIVRVRRGHMTRLYQPLVMLDQEDQPELPMIWQGQNAQPWQGQWVADTDWVTLPEIESFKWTRDTTSSNGSSTGTVIMDNIAFLETEGMAGVYHQIQRGYYSPQRGIRVNLRAPYWTENEWGDVLNGGYQIEVWEGYGPDGSDCVTPLDHPTDQYLNGAHVSSCSPPNAQIARTWTGVIDSCVIDTHPDMMTITCRDFGIFVTDQRVIYQNKDPAILSPVIFADRATTLGQSKTGYSASASGSRSGYSPSNVTDSAAGTGWVSDTQSSPDDIVWVEIELTAGYYTQFFLSTEFSGMSMWVSIQAQGGDTEWNGQHVDDGTWVDNGNFLDVPGDDGQQYVNFYQTVVEPGHFNMAGTLKAGEGTVLRLYFTGLLDHMFDNSGNQVKVGGYVAGVYSLQGYVYGTDPTEGTPVGVDSKIKALGWILVSDLSDIVRMIFLWSGFKEWDIDNFGWSLAAPFNFGQDQFFIDVITSCMNQGNFMFFMAAPTADDMSIGVACFKQAAAFTLQPNTLSSIRDSDLLESLEVTYDLSNLPYSIRVRGAQDPSGSTFGQDLVKRYNGTYFPPWSNSYVKISPTTAGETTNTTERLSGLVRSYVDTQGQTISLSLNSDVECLYAALLTAVQFALAESVGQFQMPGIPAVDLNEAYNVIDEGSGSNSRVWISSIESDHSLGENGSWHMTINGPMLDTEDLNLIAEDWAYVVKKYSFTRS